MILNCQFVAVADAIYVSAIIPLVVNIVYLRLFAIMKVWNCKYLSLYKFSSPESD